MLLRRIGVRSSFTFEYRRVARSFSSSLRASDDGTRPPFNPSPAFRITQHPDKGWKFGDGLRPSTELAKRWKEDKKAGWKTLNLDEMDKPLMYKMLTSAVVPRPIAFVSTISDKGVPNLAPFSYFSLVAHDPPLLSISFNIPANRPKDTRENIKATKEFTVNIISEPFIEAANSCSIEAPDEIDEWAFSGLTPEPSEIVKPPRVRESAVSFECKLYHFLDITPSHPIDPFSPSASGSASRSDITHSFILGRIHRAHIRHSVLNPDGLTVDAAALRALSRLGGSTYARIGEGFDIERPSWRKYEDVARKLTEAKREKDRKGGL